MAKTLHIGIICLGLCGATPFAQSTNLDFVSGKTAVVHNTSEAVQIVCQDGTNADEHGNCPIFDIAIPVCHPMISSHFYIPDINQAEVIWKPDFAIVSDGILAGNGPRESDHWTCKATEINMVFHADPTFGDDAETIAQRAGEELRNKLAHLFNYNIPISQSNVGGSEPMVPYDGTPTPDILNNYIEFKITYAIER